MMMKDDLFSDILDGRYTAADINLALFDNIPAEEEQDVQIVDLNPPSSKKVAVITTAEAQSSSSSSSSSSTPSLTCREVLEESDEKNSDKKLEGIFSKLDEYNQNIIREANKLKKFLTIVEVKKAIQDNKVKSILRPASSSTSTTVTASTSKPATGEGSSSNNNNNNNSIRQELRQKLQQQQQQQRKRSIGGKPIQFKTPQLSDSRRKNIREVDKSRDFTEEIIKLRIEVNKLRAEIEKINCARGKDKQHAAIISRTDFAIYDLLTAFKSQCAQFYDNESKRFEQHRDG